MTTSILVNGTGTLTPITLKKNYLNSIGTDAVLAYDAEQQVNPTSTGKTTVRYYYHTNQLGSIIAISTSTGQVVQKYTYNAYGKPYIYSGSTLTPLSSYTGTLYGNTRLYTGREYDRETGYYYLRARTYSPDLGRFISRDPIGQNDQVNLYTYVRNSPLNYTDRNGKTGKPMLVIGFLGGSFDEGELNKDEYSTTGQGLGRALNRFDNKKAETKLFYTNIMSPGSGQEAARKYINENKDKYGGIVLLGHSMGADAAVELSQELYEDKVNVDLLITVDLQSVFWDTNFIESNTSKAINYYQDNERWNFKNFNGSLLDGSEEIKSRIFNIDASDSCNIEKCPKSLKEDLIYHTDMDDALDGKIYSDINNLFK